MNLGSLLNTVRWRNVCRCGVKGYTAYVHERGISFSCCTNTYPLTPIQRRKHCGCEACHD